MGNTATKFHPLTGEPIRPLWIRPDGRAMWPIMGGDDTVPPATPAAPTATPETSPAGDPTPTDDGKGGKDAILADLAKERDKRQTLEQTVSEMQTAHKQQMDALAKAFGLKSDEGNPPDPAKLAEQIAAEQAKVTAAESRAVDAERQLAVFKAAPTLEGNALALLDSASFLASIKDISPDDGDRLNEAITKAVEANPLFKASATTSTPPFPGGPRTPAPPARAGSLGEAIAARLASQNR